jgi:hypothetical protein
MAVNFYEASLKKFNIDFYLFIGADQKTCDSIISLGINCYVYKVDKDAGKASIYYSVDFLRKMNIRTYMILDALNLGYNILHTDVDMSFLKNPFEDFDYMSDKYDVAPLWDCGAYNAGYLFIRNSPASIAMYRASKHIADTEPKTDDQIALNRAISSAQKSHHLMLTKLDTSKYLCGRAFFQDQKRDFASDPPCDSCVVVHHNWIVSMEAKTYRIKEMHMWLYDGNKYYSDTNRKYLYFENPHKFSTPAETVQNEINALKSAYAIAHILNRTVIFPKFHCGDKFEPCTIIYHLLLRQIESVFPDYRETTFLSHPKVPKSVVDNKSKLFKINSNPPIDDNSKVLDLEILQPENPDLGPTDEEILKWFGDNQNSVLRFHNLYKGFNAFKDSAKDNQFKSKINSAFKPGAYMQF